MQLSVPIKAIPGTDQRSTEILASIRQAFVDKGFDGASMQDLARAAGMSVGNFYRYFPSKAAIVENMIRLDLAEIQRDFATITQSASPLESLRAVIHFRIREGKSDQDGDLWTEIQAVARRSPEVRAAAQQMETLIVGYLIDIFAAEAQVPKEEAIRRFSASSTFIVVLFRSAVCLNCAQEVDIDDLKTMILRTIDQTLDDVTKPPILS